TAHSRALTDAFWVTAHCKGLAALTNATASHPKGAVGSSLISCHIYSITSQHCTSQGAVSPPIRSRIIPRLFPAPLRVLRVFWDDRDQGLSGVRILRNSYLTS